MSAGKGDRDDRKERSQAMWDDSRGREYRGAIWSMGLFSLWDFLIRAVR